MITAQIDIERAEFETAAYEQYKLRHRTGMTEDRDEALMTPENLLWRDDRGEYGVKMFNAAWWGWRAARGLL